MTGGLRRPPDRLPPVSGRAFAVLRPVWWLLLLFALAAQVGGFVDLVDTTTMVEPQFDRLGLGTSIDDGGSIALVVARELAGRVPVASGSKIVAIEGRPVSPHALARTVAVRLGAVPGRTIHLRLRARDGRVYDRTLRRGSDLAEAKLASDPVPRRFRMMVRIGSSLIAGTVLLSSAALLFRRRGRDPVALLLSFAFLTMLASIDLPLQLWLHTGLERVQDLLATIWWLLLVLALAAFPDGRFEPRWMRWLLVAAPIAAIPIFFDDVDLLATLALALSFLLLALGAQAVRFRRREIGIERQQIKWAALGFATGILSFGASLFLANALHGRSLGGADTQILFFVATSVLFSLSFAVLPLGLLVALLRFRLWEADRAIRRSVGVAGVTIIIALVWGASADVVKEIVLTLFGSGNQALATALGAVIAVGVFGPSQAMVTRWLERRHAERRRQIGRLPAKLELWRETEAPAEIGMRTLAVIAAEFRLARAALLALTPTGHALLAARGIEAPERLARLPSPREAEGLPIMLSVADDDGEVALLLLGERLDGELHAEEDHASLAAMLPALAEALRTARRRLEHQEGMLRMIGAVEARLARLEGDGDAQPA